MTMRIMQSPPGAQTVIDGRRYVYFVGTGYLGLQGHPAVIEAGCEAMRQYGIGSATSRTGFGNTPPVLDVERQAARFFDADDSIYFSTGYVGNHILVLTLEDTFDAVFVDELSHYCVFEAARLSGRPVHRFRHRDAEDLAAALKRELNPSARPLVLSDGVFAARGAIAPAADYHRVLADYPGAALAVDDAHAVGTLGEHGHGTFEHAGLSGANTTDDSAGPRLFFSGTLSKAVGGYGGIIPGSAAFIAQLKATSPYYRGASAPPIPAAAATARALQLIQEEPEMRTRLRENVAAVKTGLRGLGLEVDDTPAPIICLPIGDAQNMKRIQADLMQQGVVIAHMASYSGLGPEGALRVAVFATHTQEMIDQLLEGLRKLV